MKKLMLIAIILICVLMTGCIQKQSAPDENRDDLIVVGFSQVGAESDWRNANTKSMTEALSEEHGYRLIFDDAQNKQERQITAIRNFIQQGVDYIVLAPTTETGWDTVLSEAKAANIPVIIVDRMIEVSDHSLFTCWVGSDFQKEGDTAVRMMEGYFKGRDDIRILHLQGNLGSSAQIGRTASLDKAFIAHPEWQLVYRAPGDFTQAKGQEITEDLLDAGTEFNVIYSENDNMAYGAIEALKAAGRVPGKDVTVISFDASRRALQMTIAGEITFDIECNPLHGPRVQAIIASLEAGITPPKLTFVDEGAFDSSLTQTELKMRDY